MPIPSAIVQYKSRDYISINTYLRRRIIPIGSSEKEMANKVRAISGAMQSGNPVAPGAYLYRGTDMLEFERHTMDAVRILVGTRFTWKSFVSTSVDERKACNFCNGLLLKIQPNEHTRFYDMSHATDEQKKILKNLSTEQEILLDHGTSCRIVSVSSKPVKKLGRTYYVVEVRLV